jgi:ribosomal protein L16/L10AE
MSGKYKKHHTISYINKNIIQHNQRLVLGTFGICIKQSTNFYQKQLVQYKAIVVKLLKQANKLKDKRDKTGFIQKTTKIMLCKVKTTAYPYNAETSKAQGSRMGKGKGAINDHYFPAKAGFVLFELMNVNELLANLCFTALKPKISVPIQLIKLVY